MSALNPEMLAEWKNAVGRIEQREERLEYENLRRYALALGLNADVELKLPPLPHWAFFLPAPTDEQLDSDGHPKRGGFLPAISLPRRMFAAAVMDFEAPLLVGEHAQQTSTIGAVTHKSGKAGDLVFVEVERVYKQDGVVRVRERQSYVYRDAGTQMPLPSLQAEPIEGELWSPGPANLMRFSAATFNAHRIHYDSNYARDEEGYPALVVHGPFTAARLAGLAERFGTLLSFAFRAQLPLFLGQPIRLQCAAGQARAIRCDGETAMSASITYR